MSEHLTEEEQLVALKRWWDENGRSLIVGVVLAIGGYFGWQYWQDSQIKAQEQAASLYEEFGKAVVAEEGSELTQEQRDSAASLATQLKENFSGGLYASNAALFLAKLSVEQNELDKAEQELNWVLDHNSGDAVSLVARQRLAQIAYSKENYTEALGLLDTEAVGFESAYAELRGDVYLSQEDYDKSLAAYEMALEKLLPAQANRRAVVQMKLDAVLPLVSPQPLTSTAPQVNADTIEVMDEVASEVAGAGVED